MYVCMYVCMYSLYLLPNPSFMFVYNIIRYVTHQSVHFLLTIYFISGADHRVSNIDFTRTQLSVLMVTILLSIDTIK